VFYIISRLYCCGRERERIRWSDNRRFGLQQKRDRLRTREEKWIRKRDGRDHRWDPQLWRLLMGHWLTRKVYITSLNSLSKPGIAIPIEYVLPPFSKISAVTHQQPSCSPKFMLHLYTTQSLSESPNHLPSRECSLLGL
jgi:hypothetical protein